VVARSTPPVTAAATIERKAMVRFMAVLLVQDGWC
jgi:hypothetical protein